MPPIRSQDGETREFVVLLPEGLFDSLPRHRAIAGAFSRRFPDMKFTLQPRGARQVQYGVCIFPVLGTKASDQPMLEWPSHDVLAAVVGCLASFIGKAMSETNPNLH